MTPEQKEILNTTGNLMVKASAGTGKTFTMVSKIEEDIRNNDTFQVIAAITFTIKAAKEIRDRINIDVSEHFIGTNNSFAIEEVIKPFIKDVYGKEFDGDLSTNYNKKIYNFDEGLDKIRTEHELVVYKDSYKNFIFELALKILKESRACQLYLKSKYFKIYIDEYQDCDKDMHDFFMYLCDILKISLFVVGDDKQAIYIWRGASPDLFRSIETKTNFNVKKLSENFRSCKQIQNYSNLLFDESRALYKSIGNLSSIYLVINLKDDNFNRFLQLLDNNKKIALLRFKNDDAKQCAKKFSDENRKFTFIPKTPISDIAIDSSWLFNELAKYFIVKNYSEYDIFYSIPSIMEEDKDILKELKKQLKKIENDIILRNKNNFYENVKYLFNMFDYKLAKNNCDSLYLTIITPEYHPAFKVDEFSRVSMTFHSSKGLEFDQVILFASDYSLNDDNDIYNHYVAATRAKNKLIIIYDSDKYKAKYYYTNLSNLLSKSNLNVTDILTIEDLDKIIDEDDEFK